MAFDDEDDDERPLPDRLLPPDDRLWRHPSEIGAVAASPAGSEAPGARRFRGGGALVGACLAGAVVALGALWFSRPTEVVERAVPASTIRTAATTQNAVLSDPMPTSMLSRRLAGSVVLVRVERHGRWTNATGLVVDERGTVAAAAALVADASKLVVVDQDDTARAATLAGVDPDTGVAALVVEGLSGAPVAASERPPVSGDEAVVLGANATDAGEINGTPTVALVLIRTTGRRAAMDEVVLHDAVEIDRPVPADAHGGALIDGEGKLLGMVVGNTSGRDLGAAVPGPSVLTVTHDLRAYGEVRRAWLGVRAVDLDPTRATLLEVRGGARLTKVTPDSPAERAGLQADDVITTVDGDHIGDASDLVNDLAGHQPGDTATISVRRGGDGLDLDVELGG